MAAPRTEGTAAQISAAVLALPAYSTLQLCSSYRAQRTSQAMSGSSPPWDATISPNIPDGLEALALSVQRPARLPRARRSAGPCATAQSLRAPGGLTFRPGCHQRLYSDYFVKGAMKQLQSVGRCLRFHLIESFEGLECLRVPKCSVHDTEIMRGRP
jgi:hypothetical protein